MKSSWKPWVSAALVAVCVLAGSLLVQKYQRLSTVEHEREHVRNQLGQLRANLEREVNGNLLMVRGLTSVIAAQPGIDQAGFSAIARHMVGDNSPLRNIAGAPGMVIRLMHPLEGNEAAIGLDYREHPLQRAAALQAVERREMVVAGPLVLVQGGIGLVAREPVFTEGGASTVQADDLWGLVAAVIDVDRLYELAGLTGHQERLGLDLAIRGLDGLGADGEVFYGSEALFGSDPVLASVSLPYGSWQIAAQPVTGWGSHGDHGEAVVTRAAELIIGSFLVLLTYRVSRDNLVLRQTSADLSESEERYRLAQRLSGLGLWEWRIKDNELHWSDEVLELWGYRREAFSGDLDAVAGRIHPDDLQRWQDDVEACLAGTKEHHVEMRVVHPDGSERWVEAFGDVERDAAGEPIRMMGMAADVTERVRIEALLRDSERRLAMLITNLPGMVYRCRFNPRWTMLFVSDGCEPLSGYASDDLVDDKTVTFANIIDPRDRDCVYRAIEQAVAEDAPFELNYRIRRRDGELRDVWERGRPVSRDDGSVLLEGFITDISERTRAQRALAESEAKYRLLVENQTDLIVKVDREGRFQFVSPSYCRMFGKSEDELLGNTFMPMVHDEDRASTTEAMKDLHRPPFSCYLEQRAMTADGWRWLAWSDTTVVGDDGSVRAIIGSGRDITDRKLAELSLRESEAQYRRLFEYTPLGILVADGDSNYIDANPAICRMLGYSHGELVGLHASDIVEPGEVVHVGPALDTIKSGENYHRVWAFRRRDGSLFDAEVTATTLPDGHLMGIVRDITERVKAQQALRDSERRFRAVFDQQFQFMAILAADGTTLEINELPLKVTGASRDDFVGRPFWDSPAWCDLPEWRHIWLRRIADACVSDEPILTQDVYLDAQGERRDAAAATKAIRDERGEVEFVLVQASDNTERRHAESERDRLVENLRSLNEQLELIVADRTSELVNANHELESFTYAVSHDLRAPVRAISGFEAALREDFGKALPAEGVDFLDEIRTGARRMNALIDGLLDLSRSTRGQIQRERVDLAAISREIIESLRSDGEGRQVRFETVGDLRVSGDPRLLRVLMQNLLANAWRYTQTREVATIRVSREIGIGGVLICVEDNGVGFDPAFSHKLFEPFQRLHRQDEFPGIGIGLATAARIVRRHGGDIAGCGRPGIGARFCFTLEL